MTHCHHLTIDKINYSTVWLDAMHDRTNYMATDATVDEDLLMTESRCCRKPHPTTQLRVSLNFSKINIY